jgi:hypothetical protein
MVLGWLKEMMRNGWHCEQERDRETSVWKMMEDVGTGKSRLAAGAAFEFSRGFTAHFPPA